MFGHTPIQSNKDRKTKVYVNNTAVSASTAQSEYARYLNFIGDRFTAVTNTVSGAKTYDIALKYADKIIPYEAGVAKGSTPGYLNFNGDHFDVSSLASEQYTVTSTGRMIPYEGGTAKSAILGFLNFDNTHFDVSALASNQYTVTNPAYGDVNVFSNGTQIGTVPRRLNFTGATVTEDSGNDYFTVATGIILPDGNTTSRKYGILRGGTFSGEGYFSGLTQYYNSRTTELSATDIYSVWNSAATDAELAGFSTVGFITRRDYNPYFKIKFKQNLSTEDLAIGLLSELTRPVNTSVPVNNRSGVMIGHDDTDHADFTIWWNNGSATAQALTTGTPKDTAAHTIEITLNNTAGSVVVKWDGVEKVNSTTQVPAATTSLAIHASGESVGGTVIPLAVRYAYLLQDV